MRFHILPALLLITLVVPPAAVAQDSIGAGAPNSTGPESTITDSAGVRIVTHPSAADRPLEWTFTEVARLGRAMAEGPEALYRVDRHTVAFHPEGGFYVLDR